MHADHRPYFAFCSQRRLDRSINSLLGIIEGISIDSEITAAEVKFLNKWLDEHLSFRDCHPYNELIAVVRNALSDGVLTLDESEDIFWLAEKIRSKDFIEPVTDGLQRLHAVLGGILADGKITRSELQGLDGWLSDHSHLVTHWPFDEVSTLLTWALRNETLDAQTHEDLRQFFAEFMPMLDDKTITSPVVKTDSGIAGLCAVCPEIIFSGSAFCFTGLSTRYTRAGLQMIVERLGGKVLKALSQNTNYLVIGADGNPCWAYACYGRKVERAVELRKLGAPLLIVHEHDFHDAVADAG